MPRSSILTEYLDALARELRFDVPLSRRVRREVEDHLWEIIANEPNTDPIEAQRCAVARFVSLAGARRCRAGPAIEGK